MDDSKEIKTNNKEVKTNNPFSLPTKIAYKKSDCDEITVQYLFDRISPSRFDENSKISYIIDVKSLEKKCNSFLGLTNGDLLTCYFYKEIKTNNNNEIKTNNNNEITLKRVNGVIKEIPNVLLLHFKLWDVNKKVIRAETKYKKEVKLLHVMERAFNQLITEKCDDIKVSIYDIRMKQLTRELINVCYMVEIDNILTDIDINLRIVNNNILIEEITLDNDTFVYINKIPYCSKVISSENGTDGGYQITNLNTLKATYLLDNEYIIYNSITVHPDNKSIIVSSYTQSANSRDIVNIIMFLL